MFKLINRNTRKDLIYSPQTYVIQCMIKKLNKCELLKKKELYLVIFISFSDTNLKYLSY